MGIFGRSMKDKIEAEIQAAKERQDLEVAKMTIEAAKANQSYQAALNNQPWQPGALGGLGGLGKASGLGGPGWYPYQNTPTTAGVVTTGVGTISSTATYPGQLYPGQPKYFPYEQSPHFPKHPRVGQVAMFSWDGQEWIPVIQDPDEIETQVGLFSLDEIEEAQKIISEIENKAPEREPVPSR